MTRSVGPDNNDKKGTPAARSAASIHPSVNADRQPKINEVVASVSPEPVSSTNPLISTTLPGRTAHESDSDSSSSVTVTGLNSGRAYTTRRSEASPILAPSNDFEGMTLTTREARKQGDLGKKGVKIIAANMNKDVYRYPSIGSETEMSLVHRNGIVGNTARIAPEVSQIMKRLGFSVSVELAAHQPEFAPGKLSLKGDVFARSHMRHLQYIARIKTIADLVSEALATDPDESTEYIVDEVSQSLVDHVHTARKSKADPLTVEIMGTGMLPSIMESDLHIQNISPNERYFALGAAIEALKGERYEVTIPRLAGPDLHIEINAPHSEKGDLEDSSNDQPNIQISNVLRDGTRETVFRAKLDNLMAETLGTSRQDHYESPNQDDFVRDHWISWMITPVLFGASTNSPRALGEPTGAADGRSLVGWMPGVGPGRFGMITDHYLRHPTEQLELMQKEPILAVSKNNTQSDLSSVGAALDNTKTVLASCSYHCRCPQG